MNKLAEFTGGVFLIDFEFRPENGREGNTPEPVCLVEIFKAALHPDTGKTTSTHAVLHPSR
jgi:hypothetical protein